MNYMSFTDLWGTDGWVDHVGWPIADGLITKWSPVQLAVWRRDNFQKCCDLENRVRGPSRSLETSPFDRAHTTWTSYWRSIVTMALSLVVSEIFNVKKCIRGLMKSGLKVTQGHPNRHVSIRHLWFPISVPYQPWAYFVPFTRWTAISIENRKFFPPTPYILRPRWRGSPGNWVSASGIK